MDFAHADRDDYSGCGGSGLKEPGIVGVSFPALVLMALSAVAGVLVDRR